MYKKDRIMRKLLGKSAVESSPSSSTNQPTTSIANFADTSSPASHTATATGTLYRPRGSLDTIFDAGSPIDRIARSPDGHSAILASRHTLKTISIHGTSVKPGVDLRAAILAQSVIRNSTVSVSDQLSIRDVKWLRGHGDTYIFTACANGKIFQYDLRRLGGGADGAPMEVIHMREDSRQTNTLDINPSSSKMLAGSQDGVVRCFDIMNPVRSHTGHVSCRPIQSFKCNAGGVQCLQWSPNIEGAFYFACGTDQGVIMKWDIRKSTAPVLRLHAHDSVTSIAWHFDGDHLASAGWDKKCCIWDVSATAEKRQKPKCIINTPASVADLAWRPATWSATAHGKRAAQLAVTYDNGRESVNMCHIWDLARPTVPFKVVHNFDSPPRALVWHDQDLLWTGGADGLFNQFDIASAAKVVDQMPTSILGFSSQGDVIAFLDERQPARRPHRNVIPSDNLAPAYSPSSNSQMLSISRSDSEDEDAASFLGLCRARPIQRRTVTTSRSAHTLSITPPSGSHAPSLSLEQSIKAMGLYRSQQAMTIGRMPPLPKVHVYEYLSTHYLETLYELLPWRKDGGSLEERVAAILEHYAKAAETIGFFRLAQGWRILALAMHLLLTRRAQYHLDIRSGELERSNKTNRKVVTLAATQKAAGANLDALQNGLHVSAGGDKAIQLRSLLSEELESTLNGPTPVTQPQDGYIDGVAQALESLEHRSDYGRKLSPVEEGVNVTLPPPSHSLSCTRRRLHSEPTSTQSSDSDSYANMEGDAFYEKETANRAIDVPNLGGSQALTPHSASNTRDPVARHDSGESFLQSSRHSSAVAASSSVGSQRRSQKTSDVRPELARSTSGREYESRIRGAKLLDSDPPSLHQTISAPSVPLETTASQSTEDAFPMTTQTTLDSIDTKNGESHPRPDSYPVDGSRTGSVGASPHSFDFRYDDLQQHQDMDYLPWPDDPLYPHPIAWEEEKPAGPPHPLDPYKVVSRALNFETQSSALNASAMVMLLRPLVHDANVIDSYQATAILKQYHSRLMGMKLLTQAALLRKMCIKGWPGDGLLEWGDNYAAIYRLAQSNTSMAFICSTCHKPREMDRRNAQKRLNPIWQCERCAAIMAPCAICLHRDEAEAADPIELSEELIRTADDGGSLSTWWYCNGCGHGGHASCFVGWHAVMVTGDPSSSVDGRGGNLLSEGCCPLDGCGHACLPGTYRTETTIARTEEVSRVAREFSSPKTYASGLALPRFGANRYSTGSRSNDDIVLGAKGAGTRRRGGGGSFEGSVYDDSNDVMQSCAVETARESLAGLRNVASAVYLGGNSADGDMAARPMFSSCPDRERRKTVKFANSDVGARD